MIELLIHDGTSAYTYGPDRLVEQSASVETQITEYRVELEDIQLTILPEGEGPNATPELAGYNDITDIPDDTIWRAQVQRRGGEVLLNGAVRWEDIDYDGKTKTFGLRVYDRASALFQEEANNYYVDRLAKKRYDDDGSVPRLDPKRITTHVRLKGRWDSVSDSLDSRDAYGVENWRYHRLTDILDHAIYEVGQRADSFSVDTPGDTWDGSETPLGGFPLNASLELVSKDETNFSVTVKDTSSNSSSGIDTVQVDWRDGSTSNKKSPGSQFSHTYGSSGLYRVDLIVISNDGLKDRTTLWVSLDTSGSDTGGGGGDDGGGGNNNEPPVASFDVTGQDGFVVAVQSTASDPDGDIETYKWYWPDGKTTTGYSADLDHNLNDASQIDITHEVIDSNGNSDSVTRTIGRAPSGGPSGPISGVPFARSKTLTVKSSVEYHTRASTSEWPEPVWELKYDKADGPVSFGYTPWIGGAGYFGLPGWTVDAYIQEVLKLTGWRMRVQFTSFPERRIVLRFFPQEWDGPRQAVNRLDGEATKEGWGIRAGRSVESWGIKLKGDPDSVPDPTALEFVTRNDNLADGETPVYFGQAAPWMFWGASEWDAVESSVTIQDEKSETGGFANGTVDDPREIDLDKVVESKFRLPAIRHVESSATQDNPYVRTGFPLHPQAFNSNTDLEGFVEYDAGEDYYGIARPPVKRNEDLGDDSVFIVDPFFNGGGTSLYSETDPFGANRQVTYATIHRRYWPRQTTRPEADFNVSTFVNAPRREITVEFDGDPTGKELHWYAPSARIPSYRFNNTNNTMEESVMRRGTGPHTFSYIGPGVYDIRLTVIDENGGVYWRNRSIPLDTTGTISDETAPTHITSDAEIESLDVITPATARAAYQNPTLRRTDLQILEGRFTTETPSIGDPTDRYELDGNQWFAQRFVRDSKTDALDIEAARPTQIPGHKPASPSREPDGWTAGPNLLDEEKEGWTIAKGSLSATYQNHKIDGSGGDWFLVATWKPPEQQVAHLIGYIVILMAGTWASRTLYVPGTSIAYDMRNVTDSNSSPHTSAGAQTNNPRTEVSVRPVSAKYYVGSPIFVHANSP